MLFQCARLLVQRLRKGGEGIGRAELAGPLCHLRFLRTQGIVDEIQGINGARKGGLSVVILYSCRRAQTQRTPRVPCRRRVDAHGTQSKALHAGSTRAAGKREATLREEPQLAFPLPLSPTRGEAVQSYTARESSTQKNPPTRNG
jgi:hypothetical protein